MPTPSTPAFAIFLACAPGLEHVLADEARGRGFKRARADAGGVTIEGGWPDVWRANLWLRGPTKVIARIASFRAERLEALETQARRVHWRALLRTEVPVQVEAVCRQSRIYHSGAAAERVANAVRESAKLRIAEDAEVTLMVRIDNDVVTIGVDTSGELLHKRGNRVGVSRAPMRATTAAMFLRQCGFSGREPMVDPMCGAGTFVLEAAEVAAGLNPGRARSFAFEQLVPFDAAAWAAMKAKSAAMKSAHVCYGFDRDATAIALAEKNAARAGIAECAQFSTQVISELRRPEGPPGLVMVNPPYGARIGDPGRLTALYVTLGQVLRSQFAGWRVGLVTTERTLAEATRLPFLPPGPPVAHGGLRVTLYRTPPLPVSQS
jgi:putative N6-adenine-specific DNA methylase